MLLVILIKVIKIQYIISTTARKLNPVKRPRVPPIVPSLSLHEYFNDFILFKKLNPSIWTLTKAKSFMTAFWQSPDMSIQLSLSNPAPE